MRLGTFASCIVSPKLAICSLPISAQFICSTELTLRQQVPYCKEQINDNLGRAVLQSVGYAIMLKIAGVIVRKMDRCMKDLAAFHKLQPADSDTLFLQHHLNNIQSCASMQRRLNTERRDERPSIL